MNLPPKNPSKTGKPEKYNTGSQSQKKIDRRAIAKKKAEDRRANLAMIKALNKEARVYCELFIDRWAKRGAAHYARFAGVATNGKPVSKRKVDKVKIQKIRTSAERISIKILVSKRTMFGFKSMLPYAVDVAHLVNKEALFELSAACERVVKFDENAYRHNRGVWIHVYRLEGTSGLPRYVSFNETLAHYPIDMAKRGALFLGIGENRTVHQADLNSFPHILIGGTTGGAKSNMIKNIISGFLRFATPQEIQLALIDFKTLEFAFYEDLPHLYRPVVNTPEQAMNLLDDLIAEMGSRIGMMKGHATNLYEWNEGHPDHPLPRIVVIVDEFAELSLSEDKRIKDRTLLMIARFTALGRAIGMHFIACTQRPAAEIMPMTIKANLPLIISGPVPSQHHSMTMFGTGDAARIEREPGRMIYKANLEINQIQTPYVSPEDRRLACRIAKGRFNGVIRLNGVDPEIDPAGLTTYLTVNDIGPLNAGLVDSTLCEFAITRRMFRAYVTDLIKAKQVSSHAGKIYLLREPDPVPEIAAPEESPVPQVNAAPVLTLVKSGPATALDIWRTHNREKYAPEHPPEQNPKESRIVHIRSLRSTGS